jgi:hypothetical protein
MAAMPTPDPTPQLAPHLDRWVRVGLLKVWRMERGESTYRRWVLEWSSGRVSVWTENAIRAAIITMHELERIAKA